MDERVVSTIVCGTFRQCLDERVYYGKLPHCVSEVLPTA